MDQLIALLTSITADEFNKVVLGVVALIGLVVSPFIQWRIAKRQTLLQEDIAARQAVLQEQIAKRQADLQTQVAQRQAADNVSAKRQVWIDELRKEVAEYLTLMARLEELRRPTPNLAIEDEKRNFEDFVDANKRATELGIRIKLRLNPKEGEHNEFVRLLRVLSDACQDPPLNETDEQKQAAQQRFGAARDAVIAHLQTILKHEWERVKRGDI